MGTIGHEIRTIFAVVPLLNKPQRHKDTTASLVHFLGIASDKKQGTRNIG